MGLTNSRRKDLPQLLDQSKREYISIFTLLANTFQSDQIEDGVSPDVFSCLMLLQQGKLYINYNNKFCMASPEAVVQKCSLKKLLLKFLGASILMNICELRKFKNSFQTSLCEQLLLHRKYYNPPPPIAKQ